MATQQATAVIPATQALYLAAQNLVASGDWLDLYLRPVQLLLNQAFVGNNAGLIVPAWSIDIALFAVGGAELTGSGYVRKTVVVGPTNFQLASDNLTLSNKTVIDFAAASGSWVAAHSIGFDMAGNGGIILANGTLGADLTLASGDVVELSVGAFQISQVLH